MTTGQDPPVELPLGVVLRVLELLPPNELACSARLVCREAAQRFSGSQHRTARLSRPLPPHAAGWWRRWAGGLAQISMRGRLRIVSLAAASGCEVALGVAWRLVSGTLLPDVPPQHYVRRGGGTDCGVAAAEAGHAHLLPWLVAHRCPLHPQRTLEAVARHCDLRALQAAWDLLRGLPGGGPPAQLSAELVAAAAGSPTPDALPKVDWLLARSPPCGPSHAAMKAAAATGEVHRMQHLALRGCPTASHCVLQAAVRGGHLAAARWLVEHGGCEAPGPYDESTAWAAAAGGSVPVLRWLRGLRGEELYPSCLHIAARHGRLEAVRHLVEECGMVPHAATLQAAAGSGCVPLARYLLTRGSAATASAVRYAAEAGSLAMVRWLLLEARCPAPDLDDLVYFWTADERHGAHRGGQGGQHGPAARVRDGGELLEAARLLLGAGCETRGQVGVEALAWAAAHGALPLVRLLRGAGCGYGDHTLAEAAKGGCAAVLEWLVRDGCPLGDADGAAYVAAGRAGDAATLGVLRRLGVPWSGQTLVEALREDVPLAALRWMVRSGLPVDAGRVRRALGAGRARPLDPRGAWLEGLVEGAELAG